MTDVPGVLEDKDDVSTKFNELSIRGVKELISTGIIAGGMIPKFASFSLKENTRGKGDCKVLQFHFNGYDMHMVAFRPKLSTLVSF